MWKFWKHLQSPVTEPWSIHGNVMIWLQQNSYRCQSSFSKLQGAPLSCEWAQRDEVWNDLPCLCMPLPLTVQESPAVLQLFGTWAENAHLTEPKQNCREDPATKVIHQWEQCCSLPLQEELWALWSGWILSKAVKPPLFFPFVCGGSQALFSLKQGPQELSCTLQHLLSIPGICDWFWHSLSK